MAGLEGCGFNAQCRQHYLPAKFPLNMSTYHLASIAFNEINARKISFNVSRIHLRDVL